LIGAKLETEAAPDTTAEAEMPAAVAADTVSESDGFVAIPFEKIPTESTDTIAPGHSGSSCGVRARR
jgi:hypothetical protein